MAERGNKGRILFYFFYSETFVLMCGFYIHNRIISMMYHMDLGLGSALSWREVFIPLPKICTGKGNST